MMMKILGAAAALSLAAAPAMAAPNPAASLSVAKSVRASAPTAKQNRFAGGGALIGILVFAAVIVGVVLVSNDDNSDSN